jgi:uncharacterized protein YdeI (YjbR/CyaY-like superfamily)
VSYRRRRLLFGSNSSPDNGGLPLPARERWRGIEKVRLGQGNTLAGVTPRRPTSKWSDINRKRWAELKAAGLLTSAGLAAAPTDNSHAPRPVIPALPVYVAKALKANSKAWEFFRELAPTYRRDFVVWIHTAKRPETRERRIRESIRLLAVGKKLGLK